MNTKVFGFVGAECYDIIYYTAKVASNLGFKCIMVDLAKDIRIHFPLVRL